ncbi:MAG: TPM domain-containing protein [Sphingomonas sp.]|jgi:uncharacterized protein
MRLLRMMLALAGLWLIAGPAAAQTFPPLTGRVVDAAHILSPQQVAQLEQLSAATEQASTRQLIVATIPDLQGYPIEDYGYRLGRAWGIGQKDANNGIILIVAPNERRVRIEVGYGLEPIMTDALSSEIVRNAIIPKFKAGDMGGGVVEGAVQIAGQLKAPAEAAEARAAASASQAAKKHKSVDPGVFIFWLVILFFLIVPLLRRVVGGKRYTRTAQRPGNWGGVAADVGEILLWSALNNAAHRHSGWSGGSGGGSDWGGSDGGGFSGGGGSFGGGGASGGW